MSFYLLENQKPTDYPQFRTARRNGRKPTGTCVVHTAENTIDLEGVDSGAESVARFIAHRPGPGSYHFITDSDSLIFMAPASYEVWHDTATNNFSYGGSMAVQAGKWHTIPKERADRIVKNCAAGFASFARWLKAEHGITIPAERITRAEAHAGKPGFLGHGDSDPGRRSDPGAGFDWDLFLAEFARLTTDGVVPVAVVKPVTSAPKPVPKPRPKPAAKGWPAQPLPVTSRHTVASHKAWVELLAAVGHNDRDLTKNVQRWLKSLGHYKGIVDGDFGPLTTRALQGFLRSKGLYRGIVDGKRGPLTIRAEIAYLNLPANRGR